MKDSYRSVLEFSRGLPGESYTSEEIFRTELLHLISNNWVCVGLTDDVSEIGDLHPLRFADQPVVLTRANDEKIRAFHNICRHRGAVLTDTPLQKRRQITCPYHAWSYGLDGSLLRTPHAGGANKHTCEGLDVENLNLVEIPTAIWGPFIFINLDGNAPDLRETMRPIEERFGFLDLDLLRTSSDYNYIFDINANWKLAVENFVESYHVPMVHPELQQVNSMAEHYQILGGDHYVGLGGRADGLASLFDPPLPVFPESASAKTYEALYVPPNLMITCLPNLVKVIIINPVAPGRTQERLVLFFVGNEAMRPELDETRATVMNDWSINVNKQDMSIIEYLQQGRSSSAFDGGRFMPEQEATSLHFQKMIAKKMLAEIDPSYISQTEMPVTNIYHE